jgi:hypothetical protein
VIQEEQEEGDVIKKEEQSVRSRQGFMVLTNNTCMYAMDEHDCSSKKRRKLNK